MASPTDAHGIDVWILGAESRSLDPAAFVAALAARVLAVTPLARLSTSVRTKHPELWVLNPEWKPHTGTVVHERKYAIVLAGAYAASPAEALHRGAPSIRGRIADGDRTYAFYDELRASGITDYYAIGLPSGDGERTWASFGTLARDGFTAEHIALFDSLTLALSIRLELAAAHHTTRSLLGVYLGENAASRVLSGAFKRGTGELARAAVLFSDMRGFTSFADRRSPGEVVATLDQFFEAVGGHIHDEGGEILKFIGDAVLAIFRVSDGPGAEPSAAVCSRALRAAVRALESVTVLNGGRAEPLHLGVALHFGDVMYGNIGARERLDFTVIGAAVNEASRIEGLCKVVGRPLLASSAFVDELGPARGHLVSAGKHAVKGVGSEIEVFTTPAR